MKHKCIHYIKKYIYQEIYICYIDYILEVLDKGYIYICDNKKEYIYIYII